MAKTVSCGNLEEILMARRKVPETTETGKIPSEEMCAIRTLRKLSIQCQMLRQLSALLGADCSKLSAVTGLKLERAVLKQALELVKGNRPWSNKYAGT